MESKKIKMLTVCGVITALSMIFSYIESVIMLALPIPVPGVKLGVANIAVIVLLYIYGWKEACIVNLIRITLTAILFGNINSFLFSMAGGILSVIVMVIFKKIRIFSVIGTSIAGGVAHNIGQIFAAVLIMESGAIAYYLPVLLISGIVTGIIIGIVGGMVSDRVRLAVDK